MTTFRLLSAVEQVAAHLRVELASGRWQETLPGVHLLAKELQVSRPTVEGALRALEKEGLLSGQGAGRRRLVVRRDDLPPSALRVKILVYDVGDLATSHIIELRHQLQMAGHQAEIAAKTLEDLKMDPRRVARFVATTDADVWVVASASLEVLQWFSEQPVHAFSLFGRLRGVPMAGATPRGAPAIERAVERLVELGHSRIVLITREDRRKPHPGDKERAFLEALQSHGIPPGAYHLPDWGNDMADFHRLLGSLFHLTPPTALIFGGAYLFIAAERHLAQRGIVAPRDVSLVSTDYYPDAFFWCDPPVSHIHWDHHPIVRRVVRWANNVARGKEDHRQTFTKAEFVEGGTVGPAPE